MPKRLNFELNKIHHLIGRQLENECGNDCNVTKTQGAIIHFLAVNSDRDIFQRDIEEHFKIRRSTVSVLLGSMENNGYIERCSVDYDARLKKLVLTEKAIAQHNSISCFFEKYDAKLTEGISESELEIFYGVLDKIKHNIEKGDRKEG